jgi:hypothetical protein
MSWRSVLRYGDELTYFATAADRGIRLCHIRARLQPGFSRALEFGHLRAEPALECGGLTPLFWLNMLGRQMPHR